MKLYHGGPAGLRVGQFILPPDETHKPSSASYGAHSVCRRDRVYLTSSVESATTYAAMHPSLDGQVYVVEPVGELVDDPDCIEPGLSYEAERARIVGKIMVRGKDLKRIRKWMMEAGR